MAVWGAGVSTSGCTLSPVTPNPWWTWWLCTIELPWPFLAPDTHHCAPPQCCADPGERKSRSSGALTWGAKSVGWWSGHTVHPQSPRDMLGSPALEHGI